MPRVKSVPARHDSSRRALDRLRKMRKGSIVAGAIRRRWDIHVHVSAIPHIGDLGLRLVVKPGNDYGSFPIILLLSSGEVERFAIDVLTSLRNANDPHKSPVCTDLPGVKAGLVASIQVEGDTTCVLVRRDCDVTQDA